MGDIDIIDKITKDELLYNNEFGYESDFLLADSVTNLYTAESFSSILSLRLAEDLTSMEDGFFKTIWDVIVKIFKSIYNAIKKFFLFIVDFFKNIFGINKEKDVEIEAIQKKASSDPKFAKVVENSRDALQKHIDKMVKNLNVNNNVSFEEANTIEKNIIIIEPRYEKNFVDTFYNSVTVAMREVEGLSRRLVVNGAFSENVRRTNGILTECISTLNDGVIRYTLNIDKDNTNDIVDRMIYTKDLGVYKKIFANIYNDFSKSSTMLSTKIAGLRAPIYSHPSREAYVRLTNQLCSSMSSFSRAIVDYTTIYMKTEKFKSLMKSKFVELVHAT